MAVKLNQNDLEFVLNQIKIAEAHAAGAPLTDMIDQPHLPYGLRTVDGSYNNILPGRELWGAADQTMPRMFDPNWNNDGDGDTMPFGPPGSPVVTNTDYEVLGQPSAGNGGHTGNVADAEGDDIINAGTGNDTVYGGGGNDRFVVTAPETGTDGNDVYWGDDVAGGMGVDTLDMSAISANITANLGVNGGVGSASSAQTGSDALWNIENIVTGSGNDVITAGFAQNVMDGGAGDDIFRFLSAGDADGDTINGFMPGDRIDLSAIDADATQAGSQSFTLANGPLQLEIAHETRADGDYTVVSGNVQGADAASFSISIKGTHTLDASDFV